MARAQRVAGVSGVVDQLQVARPHGSCRPSISRRWRMGHHHGGYAAGTSAPMGGEMTGGRRRGRPTADSSTTAGPLPEGPAGGAGGGAGAVPGAAELRLAQLRPVPQLLGRRLPDGLPLAGLAEHRPLLPLPRSAPRLACGDPALGRRHLVARLQEALHPAVLHPLSVRPLRLLSRQSREEDQTDAADPSRRIPREAGRVTPGRLSCFRGLPQLRVPCAPANRARLQ